MCVGKTAAYKPSFKEIMRMADEAEMWLILLILVVERFYFIAISPPISRIKLR